MYSRTFAALEECSTFTDSFGEKMLVFEKLASLARGDPCDGTDLKVVAEDNLLRSTVLYKVLDAIADAAAGDSGTGRRSEIVFPCVMRTFF